MKSVRQPYAAQRTGLYVCPAGSYHGISSIGAIDKVFTSVLLGRLSNAISRHVPVRVAFIEVEYELTIA